MKSHIEKILSTRKSINNAILIIFAIFMSGYVTARSIIPGVGFTLVAVFWLVYCFPFYYQKKLLTINSRNFFVLLFLFVVMFSGAMNFGEKFSNQVTLGVMGSLGMYFILISLIDSHEIIKKMIIINILLTIPITIIFAARSWFEFNSLWLSPYWNNNYAFGKNVVGFFTVFCFNFLYSYFLQKRTLIKLIGLIILFLITIYTISRSALISLVIILLFTPIIAKNKRPHVYFLSSFIVLYILFVQILDLNPLRSFLEIKNRGSSAQLGYEFVESNSYQFYNFKNTNSPGSKYGLSRRAGHFITTKNNFIENPIFGSGVGSFRRQEGTLAHSDYLTILFEYGIIGLFIFISIGLKHFFGLYKARNIIKKEYRWILEASMVQIAILAFTFFTIDAYMVPFTWYILAISAATSELSKKEIYLK